MSWFKNLFPTVKDMYDDMDIERKKRGEVWHYECENGHKWESYSSPTGTLCRDSYGMTETCCPKCKSTICRGNVYKNGKLTDMGACHVDFKEKK